MQILSEELPVEYFIPDSSHMDILCGREGRNRYYYRQGSDSLWCVGHENATFYIDYARPELLLRYPFAYGDSLTSRFEGAGRYGQRIPLTRRATAYALTSTPCLRAQDTARVARCYKVGRH